MSENGVGDQPDSNGKMLGGITGKGFMPGQSGNPAGRKPGTGLTDRLRKVLAADDGKVADSLINAATKAALSGDFRFWKEIIDRMDGPIKQQLEARIERIAVEWEDRERMFEGDDDTD